MANYYVRHLAAGTQDGLSWANAKLKLAQAIPLAAPTDTIFVSDDHVETSSATTTFAFTSGTTIIEPIYVLCADHTTEPPQYYDLRYDAVIGITGAFNLGFSGNAFIYGISFSASGTSPSTGNINMGVGNNSNLVFEKCVFRAESTSNTGALNIGSAANGGIFVEWRDCTVYWANEDQMITSWGNFRWVNSSFPFSNYTPHIIFNASGVGEGGSVECVCCDFSSVAFATLANVSTNSHLCTFKFIDCMINADSQATVSTPTLGSGQVDLIRCTSNENETIERAIRGNGDLVVDNYAYLSSNPVKDANDIPYSWNVGTETDRYIPYRCPPIVVWNDIIETEFTVRVECTTVGEPTNNSQVWLEIECPYDEYGAMFTSGLSYITSPPDDNPASTATWEGPVSTPFALELGLWLDRKGWLAVTVCVAAMDHSYNQIYVNPAVTITESTLRKTDRPKLDRPKLKPKYIRTKKPEPNKTTKKVRK
jgi:hypothetical protein